MKTKYFVLIIINSAFGSVPPPQVPPYPIAVLNQLQVECWTCEIYYQMNLRQQNRVLKKDEILKRLGNFIQQMPSSLTKEAAKKLFENISKVSNHIIENLRFSPIVEDDLKNLNDLIMQIDQILPEKEQLTNVDFYQIMDDIVKIYNEARFIDRPGYYDQWLKRRLSLR